MSRHRRQRAERDEDPEDDDEREPLPRAGNPMLFMGAALVAAGFVAGYLVGKDAATRTPLAQSMANAPFLQQPQAQESTPPAGGSGSLAPAVLPPPHKGHTFTGNVDVPPHSEQAHQLADVLLRDVTCPCGGCDHMTLGTCTCDTAKEVGGFAAHLLERGKRGDEVLTALAPRYGLDIADHLASARGISLANPQFADAPAPEQEAADVPASSSSTLDGLSGLSEMASKPGVQRLIDVPTSARPKPKR